MASDQKATSVIVHDVLPQYKKDYEDWSLRALEVNKTFPGYLATDIIRPLESGNRYIVIIRFEDEKSAQAWLTSIARQFLLSEATLWLAGGDHSVVRSDSDFWFNPSPSKKPRRSKQWILTWVAVFPLTSAIPPIIATLDGLLPFTIPSLAMNAGIAAIITGIMTFWAMPFLVKNTSGWLAR